MTGVLKNSSGQGKKKMRKLGLKGFSLTALTLILALTAGCRDELAESKFIRSADKDFHRLPGDVLEDTRKTIWREDNLTALLLAGGASVTMNNTNADDKVAEHFSDNKDFNDAAEKTFDILGGPGAHFTIAGLWYYFAVENEDQLNKDRAWIMIRALSTTGLWTTALKAARGNDTPNGKDWAWPSGHTSSSFAFASVLDEFYGPEIGIPAYVFASFVGYRMMDTGDHWASDVVFGATLGWIVGHTVAGNQPPTIAGFQIMPLYLPDKHQNYTGLALQKNF